jgi:2,4-dienoyl-CoA reductase-like NADH-dependent reductase (Old Yellow Enzyme family)
VEQERAGHEAGQGLERAQREERESPVIVRVIAPGVAVESGAVEKAGATILNTGIGWHEARIPTIAQAVPSGGFAWATKNLKQAVKIPVVASNRINAPEIAAPGASC